MLGRLLRTSSFSDLVGLASPSMAASNSVAGAAATSTAGAAATASTSTTTTAGTVVAGVPAGATATDYIGNPVGHLLDHTPEDLRLLLYGSRQIEGARQHVFRVLVAQELGCVMSRHNYQVVLDCSTDNKNTLADQMALCELKEYIFGSPVRVSDRCTGDKLRVVAAASSGEGVVLATRTFYVNTGGGCVGGSGSGGGGRTSGVGHRLAIAICVPESLLPTLPEAWPGVTAWFDDIQRNLLCILQEANSQLLPRDLRSAKPSHAEAIVQSFHKKLLPLLVSLGDIPRLLLYPDSCAGFVTTWFRDVFNWLEIKDGHRLRFLPVLLAKLVYDFRDELCDNSASSRIVIISGNMAVANKLVFILSALLKPKYPGPIPRPVGKSRERQELASNAAREPDAPGRYSSTVTSKGWEIPKKPLSMSTTSVSSDETSQPHVIQPSSFRSGGSSVQYLSSSLSSAHGSYGSWFSKRSTFNSPSAKHGGDPLESPLLGANGSTPSLHHYATTGAGANSSRVTPQPSPSLNEYDEYPWFGTAMPTPITASPSPRTDKKRLSTCPSPLANQFPLHDVDVRRTFSRAQDSAWADAAFSAVCLPDEELAVTPATGSRAGVLEVPTETYHGVCSEGVVLPRYTSFLPSFNHWFQLQAFPIASDSEKRVVQAMKRDLDHNEYSRTLLVSLRSREIKDIVLTRDPHSHKIVQKTKKIFNNGKRGNVSPKFEGVISTVEWNIKRAAEVWEECGDADERDESLRELFKELMA